MRRMGRRLFHLFKIHFAQWTFTSNGVGFIAFAFHRALVSSLFFTAAGREQQHYDTGEDQLFHGRWY